jgi:hypothetical protein
MNELRHIVCAHVFSPTCLAGASESDRPTTQAKATLRHTDATRLHALRLAFAARKRV